jgi:choline dehydrogenase-like flavoprotein
VTLNEMTRGLSLVKSVLQYALTRKGILTYGTGLVHGFMRTRPDMISPDVQLFFLHASYANAAERKLDKLPGMTIGVTQLRPESRGTVHIASADPGAPPIIRPNFLNTPEDCRAMVDGMKMTRDIVAQSPMDAFRGAEISPGERCQSDGDWLQFARDNGQTIYHACGTCRMGADAGAVVDPSLRLRGLEGLRVVDASIMPTIVSGNTQAAVFMIAEKGADLILQDAR